MSVKRTSFAELSCSLITLLLYVLQLQREYEGKNNQVSHLDTVIKGIFNAASFFVCLSVYGHHLMHHTYMKGNFDWWVKVTVKILQMRQIASLPTILKVARHYTESQSDLPFTSPPMLSHPLEILIWCITTVLIIRKR